MLVVDLSGTLRRQGIRATAFLRAGDQRAGQPPLQPSDSYQPAESVKWTSKFLKRANARGALVLLLNLVMDLAAKALSHANAPKAATRKDLNYRMVVHG